MKWHKRFGLGASALFMLLLMFPKLSSAQQFLVDLSRGPLGAIGPTYTDSTTGLQLIAEYCNDTESVCTTSISSGGGAWTSTAAGLNLWRRCDLCTPQNPLGNGIDLGLGVCDPNEGTACANGMNGRPPGEFNELSDEISPEIIYLKLPTGYKWVSVSLASLDSNATDVNDGAPEQGDLWADQDLIPNNGNATMLAHFSGVSNGPAGTPTISIPLTSATSPYLFLDAFGGDANNDYLVYQVTLMKVTPPACTIPAVTISNTSWNSFNIPAGTKPVVWVHAHIGTPSGVSTTTTSTVLFTHATLTLNGTPYPLPDGLITFDPTAPSTITTHFDATLSRWETLVNPHNFSDEMFFLGAAIPVTPAIAAGAKATLTYEVQSSDANLSFPWQWSAAVYTFWPQIPGSATFSPDYNTANIQPLHNSLHAGTPLDTRIQKSLIQGPRGGGGSNFTGSWSATGNGTCPPTP